MPRPRPPARRQGDFGRPVPGTERHPERLARPVEKWRSEQYVAVDLRCKECDSRMERCARATYSGAPEAVIGHPVKGTISAVVDGDLLLTCTRCERFPSCPLAWVEALLADMYTPGGHAVESVRL
jgi:hypothetical protein